MKKTKRLMSLRAAFVMLSAFIMVLVLILVTAYSATVQSKAATSSVKAEIQSKAESTGNQLKAEMEVAMDASRTLADSLGNQNAATNTLTRDALITMLQKVITNNPTFLAYPLVGNLRLLMEKTQRTPVFFHPMIADD